MECRSSVAQRKRKLSVRCYQKSRKGLLRLLDEGKELCLVELLVLVLAEIAFGAAEALAIICTSIYCSSANER